MSSPSELTPEGVLRGWHDRPRRVLFLRDDRIGDMIASLAVIEAIGQKPNPIIQASTPGLDTSNRGTVVVDEKQLTSRRGVFAGGDLARGGATVILAMRDGRLAAQSIHGYLRRNGEAE